MTTTFRRTTMATNAADPPCWPELHRARRAIVVADVVESVRLMQGDEADVIGRWRHLVNDVRHRLLPAHGGRLVKSLGDGMLIEFEAVEGAVSAALALRSCASRVNLGHAPEAWIRLRTGVHVGDVVSDELDIYGQDVNIAQRLTTLARPDDIVVSAAVVDRLVPGLDADVEDMGPCHLKHLRDPVHAFRLRGCRSCWRGRCCRASRWCPSRGAWSRRWRRHWATPSPTA
jgi:class 3 adenylate cyclase